MNTLDEKKRNVSQALIFLSSKREKNTHDFGKWGGVSSKENKNLMSRKKEKKRCISDFPFNLLLPSFGLTLFCSHIPTQRDVKCVSV